MADLRDEFIIPAGEWVLIVDGVKNARAYQKKVLSGVGYLTVAYDDAVSNPNTSSLPIDPASDVVEKMFFDSNDWFFENTVDGYVWAAVYGNKPGILIIT